MQTCVYAVSIWPKNNGRPPHPPQNKPTTRKKSPFDTVVYFTFTNYCSITPMTSSYLGLPHEVKPPGPPLNQPLQPAVLCPRVFRRSADSERGFVGWTLCFANRRRRFLTFFIRPRSQGLQQMSELIECLSHPRNADSFLGSYAKGVLTKVVAGVFK